MVEDTSYYRHPGIDFRLQTRLSASIFLLNQGDVMPELRYDGNDAQEALAFFRTHRQEMRALRRLIVGPTGTWVRDMNGEEMWLRGIGPDDPELVTLLTQAGASFNPKTVHEPPVGHSAEKEFQVTKQDPWGHDRVI
ncbi:MAG: hypothetical protein CME25_16820 [Gemmatimonadetes bacterium]|nr:hypothetical protein [Gemmatimonadota bacterium]|tara:strand:- start:1399 stop:1809 length:411 start_codon:yes stop_codon:yes gene_type:complete